MLVSHLNIWTERVIGAGLEVHSIIGPGYVESVYEEALARELEIRKIPFERQKIISLHYKGVKVGEGRLDFLINKQLVVELKAVDCFTEVHRAQVISYLKAANLRLGLLMNFNVPSLNLGLKRVILTRRR
ncbi:GxxExxY protein [Anaerosporomusa subterranea]|uniref:GxxExxY protein n=1 Tax=Anaerosporomusa subterranea TaxID=1794912 RepID=A0A154BRB6_ANASB|nr:GxxExxY protein [Anaerosporomusa subterranea]KYZ76439.1 GxxExxY protein [Anaerosporomusa subterranea]